MGYDGKVISREEQEIWDELKYEIEKELEEEIKDGLLMLARRLQILYKHKQRRSKIHDEAVPDLSIVIKLGIGCDIDIKEGDLQDDGSRPYTPRSEPYLKKKCHPSSHGITQVGSSKSSLATSKYGGVICTSKKCNKGKVEWKY